MKVEQVLNDGGEACTRAAGGLRGAGGGVASRGREEGETVTGSPPGPDTTTLRRALDSGGYAATHVKVELVPSRTVDLPGA